MTELVVDVETLEAGGYAAIVSEAKERQLLPADIPLETGEQVVGAAQWLIEQAWDSYSHNTKGEDILTILRMAGVELDGPAETQPEQTKAEQEESPPSEPEGEVPVAEPEAEKPKPKNGRRKKAKKEDEEKELAGLPVPSEWEGEYPEMPRDVTELDDVSVRRLYSQFGAVLSRATWVLALERSKLAQTERMRDWIFNKAMAGTWGNDPESGKPMTVDTRKAHASQDEEFIKYDQAWTEHKMNVFKFQALRDVFSGHVERLSREWSMRTDERNKAQGGTG